MTKLIRTFDGDTYDQLRIAVSQLDGIINCALTGAMRADPDDIFYRPETDPEWVRLKPYYSVIVCCDWMIRG